MGAFGKVCAGGFLGMVWEGLCGEGRSPFRRSRKPRAKRVEPAAGGRAAPGGCGLQGAAGKAKQPSPVRERLR